MESFEGNLDDGEVTIEAPAATEVTTQDIYVGLVGGVTAAPLADPSPPIIPYDTDRLMEISALGIG